MRLQQDWSGEMVIKNAFSLLEAPATPDRERRFVQYMGNLHTTQLQALESALTTSQAQENNWFPELELLWEYWAGLCPASAENHAYADPLRTRHFEQARSRLNAEQETAIPSDLTKH